jgi:GTP pyrophosphokinase
VADHLDPNGQKLVRKAFERAATAHLGQHRLSGEDYVNHPLEVAAILADLELDAATIVAALLHDTVEDTNLTADEVEEEFGPEVARLVDGVTKLGRISLRSDQQQQAENIRKMMVAMAEDLRVVLIKLADRLHNMRTLDPLPEPKRRKISRETLDIYAPLAHRLGIGQIKWELEDLAFRNLEPEAYEDVAKRIARERHEREALVSDLREILARELEKVGIQAEITGRPKHIYSVWQKMTRESKDFTEIYDLSAIRVQVDSVRDCYGVLGVVHSLWKPMPGRFKDYIAMPKSNGYQSLHTTVITHTGEPIEIQIRTHEMHRVAEFGVAAHWTYKEGGRDGGSFDQKLSWLRSLLEWQNEVGDAESFLNTVKVDLFQDEVYVFTPRGDVINLPAGSTPVDFAYRIHTEVGHRCIGAKANGRMVPLDYELKNGEIVEILTSKGPHGPSRDWLSFVKSASAKERIRKWFKSQRREENVAKGRDLLDKELHRMHRINLGDLPEPKLLEIANVHKFAAVDDFMAAIGYGDLSPHSVVMRMALNLDTGGDLRTIPLIPQVQPSPRVLVRGEKGILTKIATCCQPVPGDSIVGYITRGKGVTVHRTDCINAVNAQDMARMVPVDWESDATHLYPVAIKIEAWDRQGLMRDIATVVAENRVNMSALEVHVYDDKTAVVSATVEIDSLAQLSRLMEKLEGVKDVHTVAREAS